MSDKIKNTNFEELKLLTQVYTYKLKIKLKYQRIKKSFKMRSFSSDFQAIYFVFRCKQQISGYVIKSIVAQLICKS